MEPDELEAATSRLRNLLREKVPDLLLQAECGGGLELPTPLPWGFASIPTLYELAGTAERELQDLQAQREEWLHRREREPERKREREADEPSHGGRRRSDRPGDVDHEEAPGWQEQRQQQPLTGEEPALDGDGPPGPGSASGSGSDKREVCDAAAQRRTEAAAADEVEGQRDIAPGEVGRGGSDEAAPAAGGGPAAAGEQREAAAAAAAAAAQRSSDAASPATCMEPGGVTPDDPDRTRMQTEEDAELAAAAEPPPPPPPKPYACRAFLDSLEQSRTFRSPHCEAAMVEAMGMGELYDGFGGSTLGPPPDGRELEALRNLLKDHINARWALEAVKQGVAVAKQGNYADAHKAYTRALELDPASAEAYVARGAAHANQRAFAEAERDLRHALALDPAHRNAATYLQAVLRKVEEQRQQLEALEEERRQVLTRQREREREREREGDRERERQRRRTAEVSALVEKTEGGSGRGGWRWAAGEESPRSAGGGGPAAAAERPVGHEPRYGPQGPPSAPGRLQREWAGGAATGMQGAGGPAEGGEGRRRRGSDGSSGSESTDAGSSGSGDSSGGTPGQDPPTLQPASDDIRRALEVVLKARKHKKKSKHKKQKKKHKKSKRRRRD
ncbi:hypothetical protein PLESTB_000486300 [Pleodorina starrii]|uniref:Uncharacterized protein n=1 Tax=Pleodorina starrii TaxID=330485 RepID=A0A9W6BFV6_9CHLO|nr:hypothetical protein PLESTM_000357500 [Pleodorina starrii]GLC51288.1 hypothetical protein PLESTB_000486300 [Pleodorina starrii]GLC63648.1 hypothetical protein PLESTF_000059200 [Pleodorina starrii]